MQRRFTAILATLILVGCGKSNDNEVKIALPTAPSARILEQVSNAPAPALVRPDIPADTNALLSQEHRLTLSLPHDGVAEHFRVARDACLKDQSLHCTLTSASLTLNDTVSAELEVALPHDRVEVFEKRLLARLPQDRDAKIEVISRQTSTENQTRAAADTERQLAQAIAYRDSLEQLSKRPNLTVDEVIKIHTELLEAQQAVDTEEAAKHELDSKIVLEQVDVSFIETVLPPIPTSPFDGFWRNAGRVLAASTADMLLSVVSLMPWLPVLFALIYVLLRVYRSARRGGPPAKSKDQA